MAKRKNPPPSRLSEQGVRYIPKGIDQPDKQMQTAKLFKNGRSQAVRLPKEFRFDGDEVYVKRVAGGVMLSPKEPAQGVWKDFFDALDSFDPDFAFVRDQPRRQQKRPSIEGRIPSRRAARKSRS